VVGLINNTRSALRESAAEQKDFLLQPKHPEMSLVLGKSRAKQGAIICFGLSRGWGGKISVLQLRVGKKSYLLGNKMPTFCNILPIELWGPFRQKR
jgi:hypothetical protein